MEQYRILGHNKQLVRSSFNKVFSYPKLKASAIKTDINSCCSYPPQMKIQTALQLSCIDVSNGGLGISAEGDKIFVWETSNGSLRVRFIDY